MKFQVLNPNNLPVVDISEPVPTQGDLKYLSPKNADRLKDSIEKDGFKVPIAVWIDEQGIKHLLDGHQRQKLLNDEAPHTNVPYITIPAKDLKDAAEFLLILTSQLGTITQEGLDAFLQTYELPEAEIYQAVHFDTLPFLDQVEHVEHVSQDGDFLTPEDEYKRASVNQIILMYDNDEYREIMPKLEAILKTDSVEATSPSELFAKLVEDFVNANGINY